MLSLNLIITQVFLSENKTVVKFLFGAIKHFVISFLAVDYMDCITNTSHILLISVLYSFNVYHAKEES